MASRETATVLTGTGPGALDHSLSPPLTRLSVPITHSAISLCRYLLHMLVCSVLSTHLCVIALVHFQYRHELVLSCRGSGLRIFSHL